jgi:hypothetical protein
MRFRRIAAVAAAATAVFATTAAVLPGTPVDKPQPMPALTTRALDARYAADSHLISRAASAARKAGNTAVASELEGMSHEHFIDFNSRGAGLAVEVIGNLATATRVVVLVPGSSTSLATFDTRGTASPGGSAASLAAETHRLDPGNHLAIIAWLGYNTPSMLSPAVMTSGDAGQGAQALRPFVDYLAQHGKQVALICHSYGTVVCGLAAPGLPVTDIVAIASPGMDVSSVSGLHTHARVWAGRGASDPIQYVPHIDFLGLGFGQDPMDPAFGARIFACGSGGHSSYFQPGGIALRNLAYIALGDPHEVTR